MQCPTDGTTLTMSERGGIEIDYCPQCRGVWLDRGELDKIIERSLDQAPAAAPAPAPAPAVPAQPQYEQPRYEQPRYDERRDRDRDRDRGGYQQPYYKKKKKESWLSEIFD